MAIRFSTFYYYSVVVYTQNDVKQLLLITYNVFLPIASQVFLPVASLQLIYVWPNRATPSMQDAARLDATSSTKHFLFWDKFIGSTEYYLRIWMSLQGIKVSSTGDA